MRADDLWDSMEWDRSRMLTYQDLVSVGDDEESRAAFALAAIRAHQSTDDYEVAVTADLYDRQLNKTINDYVRMMFDLTGEKLVDFTASNAKIASNFFHRLNTQRAMYSLGKGVSFVEAGEGGDDSTKEMLGPHFDRDLMTASYLALIHGVSFGFWNVDRLYVFPLTEFAPIWDEESGTLRAGVRFWRLDPSRPMQAVLYEEDGYTRYVTKRDGVGEERLHVQEEKRPYIQTVSYVPADGVAQVVAGENYSALPIVPIWGSRLHQSTLVGMRQAIDSYDLIRSGFANDLSDCAQIYWMVENAGGMSDADLARFRDRLKLQHIAVVDADSGQSVNPYVQEPPYQARSQYLSDIRAQIYEGFGALDVHTVAAGATNDHIDAAYQPMDEEASDFEYQVSEFVQQLLRLIGVEDSPVFSRSRISNQSEQVSMVVQEAEWLDHETILRKLPNISPSEVPGILERTEEEESSRMGPLMGAAAVSAGQMTPEEAGVDPKNVVGGESVGREVGDTPVGDRDGRDGA